jgi:Uncharacterised nucleotidyltransferase
MTPAGHNVLSEPFVEQVRKPSVLAGAGLAAWDRALRLARSSNLTARIATAAEQQTWLEQVPQPVRNHLVAAIRLSEHQQKAVEWECRHLEVALASLNVPIVLLKGAAYAMTHRRAAQGRLFGDIDLLVPQAALNAVEAALMLRGWSVGTIDPYDQRYYRQWMHELPPMSHVKRGAVVDVHHNILPLSARVLVDAGALIAQSSHVEGTIFRVLAPEDMVIHSAVHLFHEGQLKNGLRDLTDLDALLMEFSEADASFWRSLATRAVALDLAWPLALALRYTHMALHTPVPQSARDELSRQARLGPIRLAAFDAVYLRALLPDHSFLRDPAVSLARMVLYVRSHALRMPLHLLVLHLGRKLVMRLFKHTSRTTP